MSNTNDPFVSIDEAKLEGVSGGAARGATGAASTSNDQMMTMLTSIGNSIKDLAGNNNGGDQMMQMMMMMMMMGGFGGGGGAVIGPRPAGFAPPPTYVDVATPGGYGFGGGGGCGGGGGKKAGRDIRAPNGFSGPKRPSDRFAFR